MLLLCLTVSSVFLGVSSADENLCYGSSFNLPPENVRVFNQIFFTPSNGGARKLVKGDGEVMDPRFKYDYRGGVVMPGLTEQDNGVFSTKFGFSDALIDIITLKIIDCDLAEKGYYGNGLSFPVPRGAELLEFTPARNLNQVTVVWNRTDPNGGRGSVKRHYWEIYDLTKEDSGYYKFRGKHNKLLSWKRLLVQENFKKLNPSEGERLHLEYRHIALIWTITFKPAGKLKSHTLMKQGTPDWNAGPFEERIEFREDAIVIDPVQYQDSGTFEFKDEEGYLAQRVEVMVQKHFIEHVPEWAYYIHVAGAVFGVIFCCCCVKKCCCKKSSPKRDAPAPQTAAAPAVHHHGTTQPAGPSRSAASPAPVFSYKPMNPSAYREPTSTSGGPLVAAPGGQGATPLLSNGCDLISSDSDPRFELKGLTFPSASPLSSDTTVSDVYTSDKLNFL